MQARMYSEAPLPQGWKKLFTFAFDKIGIVSSALTNGEKLLSKVLCMRSGYFVDLAGDRKDSLSTIRQLEARGWAGLCIGRSPDYWKASADGNCKIVGMLEGRRSGNFSFGGVFHAMETLPSIDYVVGEGAELLKFPWDLYPVSVVMAVRNAGGAAKLLKAHNFVLMPNMTGVIPGSEGGGVWIRPDSKACKPNVYK